MLYLENFCVVGVNLEDVILVLLIYLYIDYVGWNIVWQDDCWVLLFFNVCYLCLVKELLWVKNSECYWVLWFDSLLLVIEVGQLEIVDVVIWLWVGGWIDFIFIFGYSLDYVVLIFVVGDDYVCFFGDFLYFLIQFVYLQWNLVFCGDFWQVEVL